MIDFLTGPMLWIALLVFVLGMVGRAVWYIRGLNWQMDRVAYTAHPGAGIRGAVRSVFFWLLPFGTRSWRAQPFMTLSFFLFHLGAVFVPLLLTAHNLILQETFGFSLPTLPQILADILTWGAVIGIFGLLLRRISLPEVRILTTRYDYLILALAAAPFVTGLLARYQVGNYDIWLTLHMVFGEALLILAPFTKLSHIILFFMSRIQLGMDYGIKRGGLKGSPLSW